MTTDIRYTVKPMENKRPSQQDSTTDIRRTDNTFPEYRPIVLSNYAGPQMRSIIGYVNAYMMPPPAEEIKKSNRTDELDIEFARPPKRRWVLSIPITYKKIMSRETENEMSVNDTPVPSPKKNKRASLWKRTKRLFLRIIICA
jgi:hypothetical protein